MNTSTRPQNPVDESQARGRTFGRGIVLFTFVASSLLLGASASRAEFAAPTLKLATPSGAPGDHIHVTGFGWGPDPVDLYLAADSSSCDGTDVGDATVDKRNLDGTFQVPDWPVGRYVVTACQNNKPVTYADFEIHLTWQAGSLAASKRVGPAGRWVEVSGQDWNSEAGDVSLRLSGLKAYVATAPVGSDGKFSVRFQLSSHLAAKVYTLTACQDCANPDGHPTKSITLTVTEPPKDPPTLDFDTASGKFGELVHVQGAHWNPTAGPVYLYLDNQHMVDRWNPIARFAVGKRGGLTDQFVVTNATPATYLMVACQKCGSTAHPVSATAWFTVLPVTPMSRLRVLPTHARPGADIRLTGSNWQPGAIVSVFTSQDDSHDPARAIGSATAGADGSIDVTLRTPDRKSGPYLLVACQDCFALDQRITATTTFTIDPSRISTALVSEVSGGVLAAAAVGGALMHWRRRGHGPGPSAETHLVVHPDTAATVRPDPTPGVPALKVYVVPRPDQSFASFHMEAIR
jgi:hypothetical protein